ncbi:MAG: 30S ribosome-binding factor RbfA [Bacteroidaceae bacterium]|nr:30S ribosome-binding factor RbfA [Bacteroidaceae bacterium]
MESTRQNKIARLIQKELSNLFLDETRKTHGVILSVSECRVSPDLSYCTAYISVFPSERADEIVNNLTANVRTIRYDLGQRLRHQLRIIPELRFFKDGTLDYMQHIDELLKK